MAEYFAKLKAKIIFPSLPSAAYLLDRSQTVSVSKLDTYIHRTRGAKKPALRDQKERVKQKLPACRTMRHAIVS